MKCLLKLPFIFLIPLAACQKNVEDSVPSVGVQEEKKLFVQTESNNPSIAIDRLAFGSCSRETLPQVMWPEIISYQPDLWVWLGDNIYGDTEDMNVLAEKYKIQKADSAYQALRARTPIIGIWDDHDYGENDGDKYYPFKEESKALMLAFLDVPSDNPVRNHTGAYNSYTFGEGAEKVKVILLDGRSFRDTLQRRQDHYQRYYPNEEGDILGEEQWDWLENELAMSDAAIHVIGCGIQMLAEEHGFEKWANFPKARTRFLELIQKTNPKRPLLISGDRHIGEIAKLDLEGLEFPLYEVTSSGLTHSYEAAGDEPNRYRVSPLIGQKHYATMDLDWKEDGKVNLKLQIRGLEGVVFAEQLLAW